MCADKEVARREETRAYQSRREVSGRIDDAVAVRAFDRHFRETHGNSSTPISAASHQTARLRARVGAQVGAGVSEWIHPYSKRQQATAQERKMAHPDEEEAAVEDTLIERGAELIARL